MVSSRDGVMEVIVFTDTGAEGRGCDAEVNGKSRRRNPRKSPKEGVSVHSGLAADGKKTRPSQWTVNAGHRWSP